MMHMLIGYLLASIMAASSLSISHVIPSVMIRQIMCCFTPLSRYSYESLIVS